MLISAKQQSDSVIYTCIPFSILPRYGSLCCTRTLLLIHSIYNSSQLLPPNSHPIPLIPLTLGNHKFVPYVCESVLRNIFSLKPRTDINHPIQTSEVNEVSHRPGGCLQVQGLIRLCRRGGQPSASLWYGEDIDPPVGWPQGQELHESVWFTAASPEPIKGAQNHPLDGWMEWTCLPNLEPALGCLKAGGCPLPFLPSPASSPPPWLVNALPQRLFRLVMGQFSSVQSLSRVRLFASPWITARQASLSITNSRSLLKLMSIESVMPSSYLILCRPLLLLPPIPPSIRVFSNESALCIRWPKYWSFSFSISPSNEHPGLISFRTDWLDLLAELQ